MKRILIPTDFSPVADSAVRFAVNLFKAHFPEFVFFHSGDVDNTELQAKIFALGLGDNLIGGKHSYICIDKSFKAELVNNLITEHKIDVVVMGTHGYHTPLVPDLFGSNTAAILQSSPVPVIAVPPGEVFNAMRKIVYASDLINLAEELEQVIRFAKLNHSQIDVLHVTPVYPNFFDIDKINVPELINQISIKHGVSGIKYVIEQTTFSNQVLRGIDMYLKSCDADVLAFFHAERSWIDKILDPSSTVQEVTHIKIPVLVFPKYKKHS
jgi:nucleotide-binding universal stress UspA family protein